MMDEAAARGWLRDELNVSRETLDRLEAFAALLRDENARQNLVSASSLEYVWSRHFVDSAQLLPFAPSPTASWVDMGSGAGFPGLVVAMLHGGPVTLVESRRLRVEFLHRAAEALGLDVQIIADRVERISGRKFDVISARAFAPLDRLLDMGSGFSTTKTRWILPKGLKAQTDLEAVESSWQGEFRLEPSATDLNSWIIIATGVQRRPKRKKR